MGFDLHGNNPIVPIHNKQEIKYLDKKVQKVHEDKNLDTSEKQEKIWAIREKQEELSPGIYFRNNVWWWRPLWDYVCHTCDDFLNEKDMDAGGANNGITIAKYKAIKIAKRLQKELKDGNTIEYNEQYNLAMEKLPDSDCNICDATGKRAEPPETGAGTIHCNGCNGTGRQENWGKSYPFDTENVKNFANFAEYSGGFQIC